MSRESICAAFAPVYGFHILPSNANSPATLLLEGFSVGVGGSVRDERIFVKSIGTIQIPSEDSYVQRRYNTVKDT